MRKEFAAAPQRHVHGPMRMTVFGFSLILCASGARLFAAVPADFIRLASDQWALEISPRTLELRATTRQGQQIALSAPASAPLSATELSRIGNRIGWRYPERRIEVVMELEGDELRTTITSEGPGSFTWPVCPLSSETRGLIWPQAEGSYVPAGHPEWNRHLVSQDGWDTLADLSMPFWGLDYGAGSLAWIATNPFHNQIRFREQDGNPELRFTHEFPPNGASRAYGFVTRLGPNRTPVEAARHYREYLVRENRFVPMKDKLRNAPKAERLRGAAHVYLWGDSLFTRYDVRNPSRPKAHLWNPFCAALVRESRSTTASVGGHLRSLFRSARWKSVEALARSEWADRYATGEVSEELSRLLEMPEFYSEAAWRAVPLPEEVRRLIERSGEALSGEELARRNALLLHAAYPEYLLPAEQWGDGVSLKMLDALRAAGLDRVRLCVSGWEGIEKRPLVAQRADEMGWLFGTYDSYHSIHDPALRGTDRTWPTAQFDAVLHATGAIVRADGTKHTGFKQAGYKLSPPAARPWVEKRVNERMARVPYSYYFVDCDGFGEVYDDYSPAHPASRQQDAAARADRLAWLRDTHSLVIGTEGGSAYAAPVVHVAEGIVTPVLGWGDPEMHDKSRQSPYYLGEYYPPDGPRVFLKQVPLQEKYRTLFYDPRFRLPLYETVFHDSVVSTHHWSAGSLKFANTTATVQLTELLYQVPPMYHLNLAELESRREVIRKHFAVFSPLHRRLGFARMTDFTWLTPDRLVQRTEFDGRTEIVANFSPCPFSYGSEIVPPGGCLVLPGSGQAPQVHVVE